MTVLNATTCDTTTRLPGPWHALADRVLDGYQLSADEALEILASPDDGYRFAGGRFSGATAVFRPYRATVLLDER